MVDWRKLRKKMDDTVDKQFSEAVEIHPYTAGDAVSEPQPDSTRSIVKTTGIYVTPGASIIGEGGERGGFDTRLVAQDVWLSIQLDNIGSVASCRQGDRVYFPDRDEWFEIAWPAPSATMRPDFHLVRMQEPNE